MLFDGKMQTLPQDYRAFIGFGGRDSASGNSTSVNPALRYSTHPSERTSVSSNDLQPPLLLLPLKDILYLLIQVYLREQPLLFCSHLWVRAYVTNTTAIFRRVCCLAHTLSPPPSYLLHGNYSRNLNTPAN